MFSTLEGVGGLNYSHRWRTRREGQLALALQTSAAPLRMGLTGTKIALELPARLPIGLLTMDSRSVNLTSQSEENFSLSCANNAFRTRGKETRVEVPDGVIDQSTGPEP